MTKRKETPENLRAFKEYKKLMDSGESNVITEVAKKFNKRPKTIYNWSSLFKWKERREKLNEEARERALKKLIEKTEEQNIRVLDKLIDNLREAEDSVIGSIEGEYSVGDYEKLIKLFRLLTDESTENSESKVKYTLSEKDKKSLKDLSKDRAKDILNIELDMGEE